MINNKNFYQIFITKKTYFNKIIQEKKFFEIKLVFTNVFTKK